MLKLSFWRSLAALCLVLVLSACGGAGGSAAAPSGFMVTPGNGQVTITWQATAGVDYWLTYAATATPIDMKNPPVGHVWATNITSPYVITGLTNGQAYSFAMNGRTSGGPGGPQTVSQTVTPRYAGASWSAGSTAVTSGTDLRGLAYGTVTDTTGSSANYVAVGNGGKVYKSTDSVAWTAVTPVTTLTTDFKSATYAFGKFIAVGSNQGANNILSSTDLLTWTAATVAPAITTGINAVASNGVTVVAVGDNGTAYFTTTGSNWTAATATHALGINLLGVAYSSSNGLWVAVGQNGTVITSSDGDSWTSQTSNAGANALNAVTVTSANGFVAVGNNGTVIKSGDGLVWALQSLGGTTPHLYAVSTDSAQFLAVGQLGAAFTSTDGSTWSPVTTGITAADLYAILGGSSAYLVVGANGTNITAK